MAKTGSKSFSLCSSSQKSQFFAVLMYALYGHPRYFKLKRKYQQYEPCFQTIFPFLMTMYKRNRQLFYYEWISSYIPLKIPERVNRVIFQNSSEFWVDKNMFKVDNKGMFQECSLGVFIIRLKNITKSVMESDFRKS